MEFSPFDQNPHIPHSEIPEGFALVPIHLFLLMAHQLPGQVGPMTITTISKPLMNATLYDRAMSCSSN